MLLNDAQNELELSAESNDNNGIKERTGFRLERRVAAYSRNMGRGNGFLATIGAISPFVGLFGTVWGIMNSFIGIAHSQTTNRRSWRRHRRGAAGDRAGPVARSSPSLSTISSPASSAAIAPAGDVAAQVLLLQGRDLDLAATAEAKRSQHAHQLRRGESWRCA